MTKARELADVIGTQDTTENVLQGRRNLIINGAMQVAQRGTSFTPTSDSVYTLDRWRNRYYSTGPGRFSVDQETTNTPDDFPFALKATVTTTDTSGTYGYSLSYAPEGYTINGCAFGTSSAKPITISFWVRSSVVGTYCLSYRNNSANRAYVSEYNITSANTWEKKTITVSGETTGTWEKTSNAGMLIDFGLGAQTSKTTTANTWATSNYVFSSNQTDWISNSGATFYLTGVQLEVGSVATPFEHRSFGEELALCQRYYQQIQNMVGICPAVGTSAVYASVALPIEMRTTPSLGQSGVFSFEIPFGTASTQSSTSVSIVSSGSSGKGVYCLFSNFSGLTSSQVYMKQTNTNTLTLDAEL